MSYEPPDYEARCPKCGLGLGYAETEEQADALEVFHLAVECVGYRVVDAPWA